MIRKMKVIGMLAPFIAGFGKLAPAQSLSQTTLQVDLQNAVEYQSDTGDPSQFATKPNITPSNPPKNFGVATIIADIVAVNGETAEVLAAVGYPGAVDGYQVNFQVPADAAKGVASVQVTAAWIAGPAVNHNPIIQNTLACDLRNKAGYIA